MNKKYADLAYQLQHSYVAYLCSDPLSIHDSASPTATPTTSDGELRGQQSAFINEKLKSLEQTLSKLKK
jgi:hypothetical protein